MQHNRIVSREEWLAARKQHLVREKELTRLRDKLNAERRALPWVKVDKSYVFDAAEGKKTLAELFDGRSQLIVHHFMLGPEWDQGCVGCSFNADHADGAIVHLENHDVSFVRVSRAPLAKIQAFNQRMGWRARWVSSFGSDFNYDYHVSFTEDELATGKIDYNYAMTDAVSDELSGISVFTKDEAGDIFYTYSCYARGDEGVIGTYFYLDLTPKGRNETGPRHNLTDWVRHHDRYGRGGFVDQAARYHAAEDAEDCCHSGANGA